MSPRATGDPAFTATPYSLKQVTPQLVAHGDSRPASHRAWRVAATALPRLGPDRGFGQKDARARCIKRREQAQSGTHGRDAVLARP